MEANKITFNAVCPNCGKQLRITVEETATVQNSGHASQKQLERAEQLKKAGYPVESAFALGVSGISVEVSPSDELAQGIIDGGTVPNRDLFRRWVTSQMFHLMLNPDGIYKAIKEKGYEYQWKMLEEELRVQVKLHEHKDENFGIRNTFFNAGLVKKMLKDLIKKQSKLYCQGGFRLDRYKGRYKFHESAKTIDDGKEYFDSLERMYNQISEDPAELYKAVRTLNAFRAKMPYDQKICQSRDWIDAYQGIGAYYTLQNLIRFHGARTTKEASEKDSMEWLEKEFKHSKEFGGYFLLCRMKEFIEENGINPKEKIAEWREAKLVSLKATA